VRLCARNRPMPKAPTFPMTIRQGSVTVRIYRVKRPAERNRAARRFFTLAWSVGGLSKTKQFADLEAAKAEAKKKVDALAAGRSVAAVDMAMEDVSTLSEIRRICGKTPPLSAVEEWARAREIAGGNLIAAANLWKTKNAPNVETVTVADAVARFIASKDSAGKEGSRTYKAKLAPLVEAFGSQWLNLVTAAQLETYLSRFENGVTRNDYRKRAVALFKWAQKAGHLPRGVETEIEHTDRATEEGNRIGIISPDVFGKVLEFIRVDHPEHLAAVVLAGFCGIRADEIHGKRADRARRQVWEDIDLARGVARVTVAKKGTAGYRPVPVCPAAVKWLMLSPDRKGPVCEPIALEAVRRLVREAKTPEGKPRFDPLPENAFRHSFCTYRLALTGNPQQVAYEAGNSPALLRKHYAELTDKATAEAWFAIEPAASGGAAVIPISAG